MTKKHQQFTFLLLLGQGVEVIWGVLGGGEMGEDSTGTAGFRLV